MSGEEGPSYPSVSEWPVFPRRGQMSSFVSLGDGQCRVVVPEFHSDPESSG